MRRKEGETNSEEKDGSRHLEARRLTNKSRRGNKESKPEKPLVPFYHAPKYSIWMGTRT